MQAVRPRRARRTGGNTRTPLALMRDDELRRLYASRPPTPAQGIRDACPSAASLLALVQREGDESARLETLDHAMSCDACRRDLDLLRPVRGAGDALDRDDDLPRIAHSVSIRGRYPLLAAGLPLVGAIALWSWLREGSTAPVVRGGDMHLVAPRGVVRSTAPSITFVWHAVPAAVRYDVRLFTAAGDSLDARSTADTTVAIPVPGAVPRGADYQWSVTVTRGDGSRIEAAPTRFRLVQP